MSQFATSVAERHTDQALGRGLAVQLALPSLRVVGGSLLAGGHGPSPFQKGPGGPWIVEPQVLSPDERAALAPKGP